MGMSNGDVITRASGDVPRNEIVPSVATASALPTGSAGAIYSAQDTGTVYAWSVNTGGWVAQGGGAGGSGNVVGPGSAVAYGVAAFADTTGKTLTYPTNLQQLRVPPGDDVNSNPGLLFVGAGSSGSPIPDKVGIAVDTEEPSGVTYMEFFVGATLPFVSLHYNPADSTNSLITTLYTLRPDTSVPVSIGRYQNAYTNSFSHRYLFGDVTGGVDESRKLFFISSDAAGGASTNERCGIGFDNLNWNEWYFNAFDEASGVDASYDIFSLKVANRIVTASAPDTTSADANPAPTIALKGGNKTAGTGNGGDLLLSNSTSAGGVIGHVYIPAISSDPTETPATHAGQVAMQFNTTDNKLWIFNGTWKSVTLS